MGHEMARTVKVLQVEMPYGAGTDDQYGRLRMFACDMQQGAGVYEGRGGRTAQCDRSVRRAIHQNSATQWLATQSQGRGGGKSWKRLRKKFAGADTAVDSGGYN